MDASRVHMGKGRLEAFSDGVIAILITIMVLDLKVPEGAHLGSLLPLLPVLLNYALSFVYLGIYWNNHHHMFHASERVTGAILWANLHLLFWLSLIPFTTGWLGENEFAATPAAAYGIVLLAAARCCSGRSDATGRASCRRCCTSPGSWPRSGHRRWRRACMCWWR